MLIRPFRNSAFRFFRCLDKSWISPRGGPEDASLLETNAIHSKSGSSRPLNMHVFGSIRGHLLNFHAWRSAFMLINAIICYYLRIATLVIFSYAWLTAEHPDPAPELFPRGLYCILLVKPKEV